MARYFSTFWAFAIGAMLWASVGVGQEIPSQEDRDARTVLDDNLYTTSRVPSMGGAGAATATRMDAAQYNPAGIGGIHSGKKKRKGAVRWLSFPYLGVAASSTSLKLMQEMDNASGNIGEDTQVTTAILDANQGERQYARASLVPSLILGRLQLSYIADQQIAAVPLGGGTDLVDTHYRAQYGPGAGFSVTDPGGRLYLGVFAAQIRRTEIRDVLSAEQFANARTRSGEIQETKKSYDGTPLNTGVMWRLSKKSRAMISLGIRNLGDTEYKPIDEGESITDTEDMMLGFSVSPRVTKRSYFTFTLQGARLSDEDTAVEKKVQAGMEYTIGDAFGADSGFGVRLGGNSSGLSGGLHVNMGFIGLELASYAEDIGVENKRLIERRNVGILSVNVAH